MKQKDILPYIGKYTNLTTAAQERFSMIIYKFWICMKQIHYMQSFEKKNGLTIMEQALNKLPVLKGKEIPSSLKFYFQAVKEDRAHHAV